MAKKKSAKRKPSKTRLKSQATSWFNRIVAHANVLPSEIVANDANWREHPVMQKERMTGILDDLGWLDELLVNRTTGRLINGHMRLDLALKRREPTVPVRYVELSEEEERRALATFDTISLMAIQNRKKLRALQEAHKEKIEELKSDRSKPSNALADLLQNASSIQKAVQDAVGRQLVKEETVSNVVEEVPPQIDRAAELQKKWKTKPGQLWVIPSKTVKGGKHRVLCGDSTKPEDVERVKNHSRLAALVTDPPYGINAVKPGGTMRGGGMPSGNIFNGVRGIDGVAPRGHYEVIANDDKLFDPSHLLDVAPVILLFGGNHYANKLPQSSRWLVWDKKNESASGTFFSDAELIWTNLNGVRCTIYRYTWSGMIRKGDRAIELAKRVVPTQKPVGLVTELIRDCVDADGPIADWYLGSGTTMVAAEQLGRLCYGLEIEPKYVAVILERMKDLGLAPRLG